MSSVALRLAAVFGATAVGLGAYGAHGFKPQDPYFTEVFKRANTYHILHALLMAAAPAARYPAAVSMLAATGVVLFSGSCYAVAFAEDRSYGKLAPFGCVAGLSMMWSYMHSGVSH